ncbi:hypothetical protein FOZ60_002118, partial [Perkinsus olseni]
AKSGMTPSKDDPRVPFNVSALVVESLAYDLILGHDFITGDDLRRKLLVRHEFSLTSRTDVNLCMRASTTPVLRVLRPVRAYGYGWYLPASAGLKVQVTPLSDEQLHFASATPPEDELVP